MRIPFPLLPARERPSHFSPLPTRERIEPARAVARATAEGAGEYLIKVTRGFPQPRVADEE